MKKLISKDYGTLLVEMALEAALGILAGIDDRPGFAAGLGMEASRTVTGLAARVADFGIGKLKARVGRTCEVSGLIAVTLDALLAANVGSSGNSCSWCENDAVGTFARNQEE